MTPEEQKTVHEIRKLELEIKALDRTWRTPAGLTAVIAIAAFIFQFVSSNVALDRSRAELAQAQASLERERLKSETALKEERDQLAELREQVEELGAQKNEQELFLADVIQLKSIAEAEVRTLSRFVSSNDGLPEANKIIDKLRNVQYPIKNIIQSGKNPSVKVQASLNKTGRLSIAINVVGNVSEFRSKGYKVTFFNVTDNTELDSVVTGAVQARGKRIKNVYVLRHDQSFDFELKPEILHKIFLPDQIRITLID